MSVVAAGSLSAPYSSGRSLQLGLALENRRLSIYFQPPIRRGGLCN